MFFQRVSPLGALYLFDSIHPFSLGLFLDTAIAIASKELHWETDYIREASYMDKFRLSQLIYWQYL